MLEHQVERAITVYQHIDTNHAIFSAGRGGEVNQDVACFCGFAGGPVDMSANIDRTSYCPG